MIKPKWNRGRVLDTPATRKFNPEMLKRYERSESERVYSGFSDYDEGRSRQLVCIINGNHPDFEANRALIEAAPALLYVVKELLPFMLAAVKKYQPDDDHADTLELVAIAERAIQTANAR